MTTQSDDTSKARKPRQYAIWFTDGKPPLVVAGDCIIVADHPGCLEIQEPDGLGVDWIPWCRIERVEAQGYS